MRIAVVDVGTNSTRLLIADTDGAAIADLERRTTVTRLGAGVDTRGALADDAMARVFATVDGYRPLIDAAEPDARIAVLTSAVRDAVNGDEFTAGLAQRYALDARTIDGDEEARLTFVGATSDREPTDATPVLVCDIGGGSTELVIGAAGVVHAYVSLQAGVVRHTERHIHSDPPDPEELHRLAQELRTTLADEVPLSLTQMAQAGIAVAGTPTSCAAILQELDPYDPARVHGYVLSLGECEELLARLAVMPLEERRALRGLHPDRAAVIVPGIVILIEVMRAFDLDDVHVSENDILRGAALDRARTQPNPRQA